MILYTYIVFQWQCCIPVTGCKVCCWSTMVDFLVRNFADRRKEIGKKKKHFIQWTIWWWSFNRSQGKKKKTLLTTFRPDIRCGIFHCIIDIWLLLYTYIAVIRKYQHIFTRLVQFPRYVVLFSSPLLAVTLRHEAAY